MTTAAAAPEAGAVSWPQVLGALLDGRDLHEETAAAVMRAVMAGEATDVQVAAVATALRAKGETAEEIAGLVKSMRAAALPLAVPVGDVVVDTCGTGGDRAGTFNVSTLAAIVACAAGVRVAKHGNRAASSRCGSADLLEAEGVVIDLAPEGVAACLAELGIGFCFAPLFHPAMRFAMPARRQLGVPTVFNYLGPLTNPAGVLRQTIGVSDAAMAPRLAAVLARLGAEHVLVFHGEDGLDELTTTTVSTVHEVRDGEVQRWRLDPRRLGLAPAAAPELRGGDVTQNQRIAASVLGGEDGPQRDIVLLGAAAALFVAGAVTDWSDGLQRSGEAVDSGAAGELLARWVATSQALAADATRG